MSKCRPLYAPRVDALYPWTPFEDEELDQSITERFEKQVRADPGRLAIKTPDRSFTYDRLNRVANRLARTILSMRGDGLEAVALLFDHNAEALAAMLAVLKAGKFYLVLDPAFPLDRLAYMLADSGAGLIVTDAKNLPLAGQLAQGRLPAVNIKEIDETISSDDLDLHPSPDALAMLLYTSGSTGKPKGVMHSHRNVLVEVRNLTNAWCVGPHDRWVLCTSLSFANSVRTIYCALLNRGALYPYDLKENGFGTLPHWLQTHRITILRMLPTTFRNFMATLPAGHVFADVRLLSVGGEPMYRSDVEAFNDHFAPPCVIAHGLGPTECFMVCLNYIPHGTHIVGAKLDIGSQVLDKEVLLVDEDGREVPAGEVGEIWVKSRYIALGYWRDAERTLGAFLSDPHDPAVRVYRTGDLGTRAVNGHFTHAGRRDFQVKIRGFRIEVSEIEVAIRAVAGVKDVVVVGREDRTGEVRLVAYFVASTTPAVTAGHIRRSIVHVVPDYMIPAVIVSIDAIPQTPNGKTDRLRLPVPPRERPQLETIFVAPATPMQSELANIWSQILAVDEVGTHDNFFQLGGDSLGIARIAGHVQQKFNLNVPIKTIFESPTVAQLAEVLLAHPLEAIDDPVDAPFKRVGARESVADP
jgi:amino acid adenylation domain-containing protein